MKFTKRETKSGAGAENYLKFKDGESKTGLLRGEIYEFCQVWPKGGQKQLVVPGTPGAQTRFRVNFVTAEDGKLTAKIFEFGTRLYNQLAEIAEEYDITKTKLKITRRGADKETVWMILPLLKEPIGAGQMLAIEAVPLQTLETKEESSKENGAFPDFPAQTFGDDSPMPTLDDLPFQLWMIH